MDKFSVLMYDTSYARQGDSVFVHPIWFAPGQLKKMKREKAKRVRTSPKRSKNNFTESLILAQDERWRRA